MVMYQSIPKPCIPPRAIPGHLTCDKLRTVGNLTQNDARFVRRLIFLSKRLPAVGNKRISQFSTSFPGSTPLSRWRPREDPGTHRYDIHVDWSEDMDILTLVVIGRNCLPYKMTDLCGCVCHFLCNRNEIIAG